MSEFIFLKYCLLGENQTCTLVWTYTTINNHNSFVLLYLDVDPCLRRFQPDPSASSCVVAAVWCDWHCWAWSSSKMLFARAWAKCAAGNVLRIVARNMNHTFEHENEFEQQYNCKQLANLGYVFSMNTCRFLLPCGSLPVGWQSKNIGTHKQHIAHMQTYFQHATLNENAEVKQMCVILQNTHLTLVHSVSYNGLLSMRNVWL